MVADDCQSYFVSNSSTNSLGSVNDSFSFVQINLFFEEVLKLKTRCICRKIFIIVKRSSYVDVKEAIFSQQKPNSFSSKTNW